MDHSVIFSICLIFSIIILSFAWQILALFFWNLWKIISFVFRILRWRFSKSKYVGQYCLYNHSRRKIIGETFYNVKLKAINGKEGNKKLGFNLVSKKYIRLVK